TRPAPRAPRAPRALRTPRALEVGRAWTPHGGSATGEVVGELVFVGHDDYAGVDARGRVALALSGAPPPPAGLPPPRAALLAAPAGLASRLEQLIAARRAGARALLIIDDALPGVATTTAPVAILSGSITRSGVDALLAGSGRSLNTLVRPEPTGVPVRVRVDLATTERRGPPGPRPPPRGGPPGAGEAGGVRGRSDHPRAAGRG